MERSIEVRKSGGGSARSWLTLASGLILLTTLVAHRFYAPLTDLHYWRLFLALAMISAGFHSFLDALASLRSKQLNINGLMCVVALGAAVLGHWFEGALILFFFSLGELIKDAVYRRLSRSVDAPKARAASLERFIETFVHVYTPALTIGAVGVAAIPSIVLGESFTPWLYRGVGLLLLAGPSVFTMIPLLANVGTVQHGLRNGMLIKDGAAIEKLATVDTVVFDQTSLMTQDALAVTDILPFEGRSARDVLAIAAGVEWANDHPVGSAIVAAAQRTGVDLVHVTAFQSYPGLGALGVVDGRTFRVGNIRFLRRESVDVSGVQPTVDQLQSEGKTVVGLADGLLVVGLIVLADIPDEESRRALLRLKQLKGIDRLVMLSSGNEEAAQRLATQLGIDDVRAELLPDAKARTVELLQRAGRQVAMVGSPVRDRAAMSAAHVAVTTGVISLEEAPDTVLEVADLIVMSDDLSKLPYAVMLCRRTVRGMLRNLVCSMGIKSLALVGVLNGELTLWMVAVAELGVIGLICLSSLRLRRRVRFPSFRLDKA